MEIEAMGNRTTEHAPKPLEAIDREIAEVVSDIFEMKGDLAMQEGALAAR